MATRRLVLLGPPGVGKGTYGALLSTALRVPLVTMSEVLRADATRAAEMRRCSEGGRLVPDALVVGALRARLERGDVARGFLLDGFPRTAAQAHALEHELCQRVDVAVELSLPRRSFLLAKLGGRRVCAACGRAFNVAHVEDAAEGVLMPALLPACGSRERCDCGGLLETRKDDTAAVVQTRLEVYDREAAPLLEWYRARGRLLVFAIRRGLQDVPKLEAAILGRLS